MLQLLLLQRRLLRPLPLWRVFPQSLYGNGSSIVILPWVYLFIYQLHIALIIFSGTSAATSVTQQMTGLSLSLEEEGRNAELTQPGEFKQEPIIYYRGFVQC